MVVQSRNASDIGIHVFTLVARLKDYPEKGYFPFNTTFKVEVKIEVILTPNLPTNYTYKIGTAMVPLIFKVNLNQGTSSVTVNG